MKKLLIIADYNDGDYVKDVVKIEDEVFEKFLPLIKAINDFEPYVAKCSFYNIVTHNWMSNREDLGEKNIYETYSQFPQEYIDEFIDVFMSGLSSPYDDCTFHTIVEISDVITEEKYVNYSRSYDSVEKKYNEKVRGFINEYRELSNYKRPKDGKRISSIPFSEMTPEENEIIEKMHNLWKKYQ